MAGFILMATVLNPGVSAAPALVLDEALSFWGGYDPVRGMIVDQHHPQAGAVLAGHVLVMPGSRGSAGTPAGIAEAIRRGVGPAGIVMASHDVNIAIGAMVADRLYGGSTPVLALDLAEFRRIGRGDRIDIALDGTLAVVHVVPD